MAERFRIYNRRNEPLTGWLSANEIVNLVDIHDDDYPFPAQCSIEWFTDETSRGIVSFDQVKRYVESGILVLPEESAGKDRLSLSKWEQRFSVTAGTHPNGCRFVPDEFNESRPYLFRLTDYIVSSVTAGTIWLVPRQCSVGTETGK